MTEPTNEQLDNWAAEKVMGWKFVENKIREDHDGAYRFTGWDTPGPDFEIYKDDWYPSKSHDQCHMVLEKAFLIDGEIPDTFNRFIAVLMNSFTKCEYNTQEVHHVLIMATPKEKLLAVWKVVGKNENLVRP